MAPTNRKPDNYEVTYYTGVQIGNSDIPVPEWVPTEVTPGSTPLPVYPQPSDLPPPAARARVSGGAA